MSDQRFPVLDRLLKKRDVMDLDHEIDTAWGSVKVDAAAASEMYWQTPKENWDGGDFPPVRPPFPSLWMEWEQPAKWVTDKGKEVHAPESMRTELGTHYAVLVQEIEGDSITIPYMRGEPVSVPALMKRDGFFITFFALREGGTLAYPYAAMVSIDGEGRRGRLMWAGPDDPRSEFTQTLLANDFLNVALLALGLMNCKNVGLPEYESKVPVGRRQRRRNAGIRYRTIDVPGRPTGKSHRKGGEAQSPLHRVRGHFKTFTADSPLMGMHVGTYWWGWQVRGNKKNGTVVSDYRLGETQVVPHV